MDHDEVRAMFDRQMRERAGADTPGALLERSGAVVRQTGGPLGWNGVVWSALTPDTADGALSGQVRHFTALGLEFEWKLYSHDGPADLAERLLAAGFVPEPSETLMVAEVADLPMRPEPPEGIELRDVTDPAGAERVAEVHASAFGADRSQVGPRLAAQLAEAPDTVVAVVALDGERLVCAARMELTPGTDFAGLWGGGTVAEWRGRGIYRATVAHRARAAAARGYRYLYVDATQDSRPILRRLGFEELGTTTPYVYRP